MAKVRVTYYIDENDQSLMTEMHVKAMHRNKDLLMKITLSDIICEAIRNLYSVKIGLPPVTGKKTLSDF